MFALIGILVVIAVIGGFVLLLGYSLFTGALKLILSIVVIALLYFALRGCMV